MLVVHVQNQKQSLACILLILLILSNPVRRPDHPGHADPRGRAQGLSGLDFRGPEFSGGGPLFGKAGKNTTGQTNY